MMLERAFVGAREHHRRGGAVVVGPQPVPGGHAPAVTGDETGKRYWGIGVLRSLPMSRWCARNSALTTAHTVWLPASSGPVLQQPSR